MVATTREGRVTMDDNRQNLRYAVEAQAYFRTGHGPFRRGQLVDVSESGVGLVSAGPLATLPEQIVFRLEGLAPVLFQVRPVWSNLQGEHHRVGLQLLPPAGASCDQKCLHRWLKARPTAFERPAGKPARRRSRRKAS